MNKIHKCTNYGKQPFNALTQMDISLLCTNNANVEVFDTTSLTLEYYCFKCWDRELALLHTIYYIQPIYRCRNT